uniref:Trehalose 6-phosphate phosphatase n=1 Tax=Aegilops tauschii subsp. strangulata TaxID=200361 RepID=A0A453PUU6_AEGTS
MPSLSCHNLLDLADELPPLPPSPLRLPRVMAGASPSSPASPSPSGPPRRVIVSHRLPLRASPDPAAPFGFKFTVDAGTVAYQLRSGLPAAAPVLHVGTLPPAAAEAASDELASYLVSAFSCLPVFLPADLHGKFYHGFCKHYMWPLLHYLLPLTPSTLGGLPFDRALYHSFLSANRAFADRLTEVLAPDDDFVWIQDYHLLALPTFLRKRFPRARVGFFLHSPFPSSEIFRTIPVRDDLLRALLNADLVGFHTFDYARHFLSACSRLLGLDYQSKRGYIGIEYYGRTVTVKILPVGIDGLNRIPYIYTVCRQESTALGDAPKRSVIVLSEFVGCSPSLSGAIRVNPWSVESVAEAMSSALRMSDGEQRLRHEKHYKYVSTHDVAYWARSFDQDLQRACKDHFSRRHWGIGFGMSFKVVALGPNFRRLSVEHIVPSFRKTENRLILLDYDGTVMPESSIDKAPSSEVISVLNRLCEDPKNRVFIVSGRGKDELSKWFAPCEKLGIAAEHGYFTRWSKESPWETCGLVADFDWKKTAEPVMRLYTEATDGSYIEHKESALVWHHDEADPDFGSCQAKELLDHLESVLANEPVVVKRGQHIVEVNPQGISKGVVVESLLSSMVRGGKAPDFVLCIGDDRSDEDMFESIVCPANGSVKLPATSEVFACTVGKKPSMAKYYLDDTVDVIKMLQGLASAPSQQRPWPVQLRVTFEEGNGV